MKLCRRCKLPFIHCLLSDSLDYLSKIYRKHWLRTLNKASVCLWNSTPLYHILSNKFLLTLRLTNITWWGSHLKIIYHLPAKLRICEAVHLQSHAPLLRGNQSSTRSTLGVPFIVSGVENRKQVFYRAWFTEGKKGVSWHRLYTSIVASSNNVITLCDTFDMKQHTLVSNVKKKWLICQFPVFDITENNQKIILDVTIIQSSAPCVSDREQERRYENVEKQVTKIVTSGNVHRSLPAEGLQRATKYNIRGENFS